MFELLLGRKEVVTTFDLRQYSHASVILENAGIKFWTRTTYTGTRNRRTGGIGAFGERVDCETQYQIFVNKHDFEQTQHLL